MSDNIHVAIRIRPLIKREIESNASIYWQTKDSSIIYQKTCPTSMYYFDRVFDMNEGNALIYQDLCAPIVQSVMQGFNGTIFAYGQTSSGKTYTMSGDNGIIPNAIHDIFNAIDNMPEREFLLRVSYMEIYNENVIDLLCGDPKNLKTMEDIDGVLCVVGLVEQEIKTSEEVFRIMKRGERKRRVGDTQMNEKSSRSHSIFRMIIESRMRNTNMDDSVVNVGQLNLVDLAGSEKSGQMGITGERFKEGVNINKSLFMLTRVISQLSKGGEKQYVNYRDSKLTRILQNSLGGNARTVIICTVTPASDQETHSTLKFASRAKHIKNKPTANMISNEKALLKRYTNEIQSLSEKLEALQQQGDDGKKEILEKELEEKNKQNERLKQQIQELKEKFVVSQLTADRSDIVLNKKLRRETWCGGLVGRKQNSCQIECGPLTSRLPILQEDQTLNSSLYAGDLFDFDFVCHSRKSSNLSPTLYDFQNSFYKGGIDAAIQTDFSYVKKEKELHRKLRRTMENLNKSKEEYQELKEFTIYEKALLEGVCTNEIEELKARNQDLEVKVAEYDALLQENNKQRNRIQELSNQIKKLEEDIYSFKTAERCQGANLNVSYDCEMASLKPVNFDEPNLLREIQASEAKEFVNLSIQVNELEACIETLETSMQTEVLHHVDEKAVQAGSVTQCVETTTQVGSPWIKKQESRSENRSINSIASPIPKIQQSIPAMSLHRSINTDDMKAMRESIIRLCSECSVVSNAVSSTYNDMKATMNSMEEELLETDIFIGEKGENISELAEKAFRLKYEQIVQDLEYKLKMKETDYDRQTQEIERLGNVCNFKDYELKTMSENIDQLKKKLHENEAELTNWREKASEKYDLYLSMLKEKVKLQNEIKEIKVAITEKERSFNNVIENAKLNEQEISKLKSELTESIKSLEMSKQELSMERKNNETKIYLCESNCDRLEKERLLLEQKVESYVQIYEEKLEETKSKSEEKITILEKEIKGDCDEKLDCLRRDLGNQHSKELSDIKMKYEYEIRSNSHAFKLEKLKFEEQLCKSNTEFINKASNSISEMKQQLSAKETECVKLRTSLHSLASKKNGNSQGDEYASKLSKELEAKTKELKDCQEVIKDLQKKFQCAEKTLADLGTSKNANSDNYLKLEKEKKLLENLIRERDNAIKDHGLKFSAFKVEFEKEFIKLKTERDTLIKQVQKLETDAMEAKENRNNIQSEVDKHPLPVNILKAKENTAEQNLAYVEMEYEFKRTQQRCKKLEQDREILMQKLSLCKNEIRRLNEPNNESKVEAKPQLNTLPASSNAANSASTAQLESVLSFKEKRIKRLEKEVQKYKDYLKAKGHHKIVEEATTEPAKTEISSSKQTSAASTPSSITTASSVPTINIASADRSLPDNKNIAASKVQIMQKIPGTKFGSLEQPKSTISNLKKEDETCKQQ